MDDITPMYCTEFSLVCLNDYCKNSWSQPIKHTVYSIRTRNRNVSYCRKRQTEANTKRPHNQQQYQQRRNCHGGWTNYDRKASYNQYDTPSISASRNANKGSNSYAEQLGPSPTNRSYRNSSYAARSSLPPSNRSESKN